MVLDPRRPVLIGVGVATQLDDDLGDSVEAVELMARATEAAASDAGAPSLLAAVERIAVPQGTWAYSNPGRLVAERVGAGRARSVLSDLGVSQQALINDVLRAVTSGEIAVAVVVGGEAKRRETLARRAGRDAPVTDQAGAPPDQRITRGDEFIAPSEIAAGVVVPVQQYAMLEQALRRAEGRTLSETVEEIAALWSSYSAVAATNALAAFPAERSAEWLRSPGPDNRPLAFPYNKWHASQWTVDQAAALLICTVEVAREHDIDPKRWVFPRIALESSNAISLSRRRELHCWPAMQVLGRSAAAHLGHPLSEVEHVELYSCFPAAVRVQQRELSLPLDGVPTITGGMSFGGGPFNNAVLQATAAMAERVRTDPGTLGLVSTVSGMLTKAGLAVWSTDPGTDPPLLADLGDDAAAATLTVESVAGYVGPATIATYTVTYDEQDAPARVVAIADTADGRRCVATAVDSALATRVIVDDAIGWSIDVDGTTFCIAG